MGRRFRILWLVILACVGSTGCARIRPPAHARYEERVLVVTGYCPCGECCGWRRNWFGRPVYAYGPRKGERKAVGVTASGVVAQHGTMAADAKYFPFGTIMHVEGYGYGRVEDRGGRVRGYHVDLFFRSHAEALRWGRKKTRVKIWFPVRE